MTHSLKNTVVLRRVTDNSILSEKVCTNIESEVKAEKRSDKKKLQLLNQKVSPSNDEKTKSKIKTLILRPEISDNDMKIKKSQILKFLSKGLSVGVKVENLANTEGVIEKLFSSIEKHITENKISAKLVKTGSVLTIHSMNTAKENEKPSKDRE